MPACEPSRVADRGLCRLHNVLLATAILVIQVAVRYVWIRRHQVIDALLDCVFKDGNLFYHRLACFSGAGGERAIDERCKSFSERASA
ncbi:hypothetical protein D3C87_1963530 [compost metagenome]